MPPKRTVSKMKKQPIPEDFELSDDEPKMVSLNKEQKLTSKNIIFDCPLCNGKLQLRNEIEINPKSITCRCNPCSFKITKNDKSMNVNKDDEGGITLESEDHSISFSWNRQITPEDKKVESTNRMISDVMGTPRSNKKKQNSLNDLE
jgi:ssDNA-binding Zn-finger/Zn-ribbon topoisomerase 1